MAPPEVLHNEHLEHHGRACMGDDAAEKESVSELPAQIGTESDALQS